MHVLVGENLKRYRLAKGLKQEEVCAGLCSVSQLSKIENGKTQAKPELMEALAKRLGLTPDDLQTRDRLLTELQGKYDLGYRALSANQFERARQLMEEVMSQSAMLGYESLYAKAALQEATIYERLQQFPVVIERLTNLLESGRSLEPGVLLEAYFLRGFAHKHNGDMEQAFVNFHAAKMQYEHVPSCYGQMKRLTSLVAQSSNIMREYNEVLWYANIARKISEEQNLHLSSLRCRGQMAHGYLKLRRYDVAIPMFEAYLQEAESNHHVFDIALSCINLGCMYLDLNDLVIARRYFERSVGYFDLVTGPYEFFRSEPFLELATVAVREGKFEEAETYLQGVEQNLATHAGAKYLYQARMGEIRAEAARRQGCNETYLQTLRDTLALYERHRVWFEASQLAVELAEALEAGQDAEAVEMYRAAIDYNHRFEQARHGIVSERRLQTT